VNRYYAILSDHKDRQTRSYVGNKIKSAVWFIDAIQQQQTMTIIETLVYLQEPYFKTSKGWEPSPNDTKNVADLIGMEYPRYQELQVKALRRRAVDQLERSFELYNE
jgi:DNA-directed RNA polymerase specialized sigma54-like protein